MSIIKVATVKNTMVPRPNYRKEIEVSIALLCRLCSIRYTAVQIKNCLKSTSVIKVATMKNMDVMQRKPSRATTKSMLFTASKDEWNTKEDTGKSLKYTLHVLQYAKKAPLRLKRRRTVKNQARSFSRYRVA